MIFLKSFSLPSRSAEEFFLNEIRETCYNTFYPFMIFPKKQFRHAEFEPVTIFCGGNGCGKTTLLNVIAQKLGLERSSAMNSSDFFPRFTEMCSFDMPRAFQKGMIITSDDVFDFMLDIRHVNGGIDRKRGELFDEYFDKKNSPFRLESLDQYEELKRRNDTKRLSKSAFVKKSLSPNIREYSNGQNAFMYFSDKFRDDSLFLLDGPENSLSAEKQLELKKLIEDFSRFFGCQFIISTHSPFLLSISGAVIYDMDSVPVSVKKWTEIESVRIYRDFFIQNEHLFR